MSRDILLGIEIHGTRMDIKEALTTSAGLASFWTSDASAEPAVGSEARFGFQGAPIPLRFSVDAIDDTEVAWTCLGEFPYWEGTRVSWGLSDEPEHGGTRVFFRHTGFPDAQPEWEFATIAMTWAKILEQLKVLLETGESKPALS
ncbi:MAG: SRPBCC domain-containing protein [Actinomycetota bacterium]